MSGYVASARIVRAAPRLARPGRVIELAGLAPPGEPAEILIVDGDDASSLGAGLTLTERSAAFRERWSQLTFFLLDPESWR
jgi:hypothetical protein